MAAAVVALIALGNHTSDVAALTEQPGAEIRRLRKLAAITDSPPVTEATEAPAEAPADRARSKLSEITAAFALGNMQRPPDMAALLRLAVALACARDCRSLRL